MAIRKGFIVMLTLALISGCQAETSEEQIKEIEALKGQITVLENKRNQLEEITTELSIEKDVAKYVITFNIRQRRVSLDIGEHLKDAMNDIDIEIPVDKEYFDAVEVGTVIDDSFRVGSLIMSGSWGKWEVKVIKKDIR